MLSINNISFYFGSRPLYQEASLHIRPKDKIGLIGANGTGKSTLLRIINGEYQPDAGNISKSGDCTLGFLNQDLLSYQSDDSILSVAMQAFERENKIQKQIDDVLNEMEVNFRDVLVDRLARLQEEFEALGGYTIQAQTEEILEGLGFSTDDLHKPLRQFSGGWRMRVMLAKLLLQKPSLLMLDEPTNHLDLPSIQWVEKYIESYEGAVIVVSHDRYFLDGVVNITVEVSGGKLNYYPGNYSFYLEEKSLRNEIQKGAFENQQAKIRQTERFIERFRAKATKSRQVQSRVKALERMDLIDDVIDSNARVNFKFNFGQHPGRHVMHLDHISKAYGDKKILTNTEIRIERGDKIALIGANGKGKSTLLRIIAGTEDVDGKRQIGHNVNFTFYAQHQLEALNVDDTLLDELKQAGTNKTETELRNVLGCFLFSNDDAFKKIKVLSGGEKSRVALAKVLISEANFLLLDEPTNHLDMVSVNILIQALQQYEGTYVVVSHDRFFIAETANKIWFIEDQQIKEYPGTYDEFEWWMEERMANKQVANSNGQSGANQESRKNLGANSNEHAKNGTQIKVEPKSNISDVERKEWQKQLKRAQQQVEEAEDKVSNLEQQKAEIEEKMADPTVFGDTDMLKNLNQRYQDTLAQLSLQNQAWENAMLEVEKWEKQLK